MSHYRLQLLIRKNKFFAPFLECLAAGQKREYFLPFQTCSIISGNLVPIVFWLFFPADQKSQQSLRVYEVESAGEIIPLDFPCTFVIAQWKNTIQTFWNTKLSFALGKVESPYLAFPLWYLFLSIVFHWNSSISCYMYIYDEFGFFPQYTVPANPVDKAIFFGYYKLNIWYFLFTSTSI